MYSFIYVFVFCIIHVVCCVFFCLYVCCVLFEQINTTRSAVPGRTGPSTPPGPRPGRWQTSLRTESRFWQFLLRDRAYLRSGRRSCPSGASRHGPEHTCEKNKWMCSTDCTVQVKVTPRQCVEYLQLSGVESFIDVWHVARVADSLQWKVWLVCANGSSQQ